MVESTARTAQHHSRIHDLLLYCIHCDKRGLVKKNRVLKNKNDFLKNKKDFLKIQATRQKKEATLQKKRADENEAALKKMQEMSFEQLEAALRLRHERDQRNTLDVTVGIKKLLTGDLEPRVAKRMAEEIFPVLFDSIETPSAEGKDESAPVVTVSASSAHVM